jgi:hypothetical protein
MSFRRRIGVSTATSESARRALMQPVQCWEKVWTAGPGNIKIHKWVKTDRAQVRKYSSNIHTGRGLRLRFSNLERTKAGPSTSLSHRCRMSPKSSRARRTSKRMRAHHPLHLRASHAQCQSRCSRRNRHRSCRRLSRTHCQCRSNRLTHPTE